MKTQILKSIFLFCILNLAFCIYSSAQIVYTDIVDDTCNTTGCSYNLDLNNDFLNDFTINYNSIIAACTNCPGPNANLPQITFCATFGNAAVLTAGKPARLNFGDNISASNVSAFTGCPFLAAYISTHCYQGWCLPGSHTGNWGGFPSADHYLGLMIQAGSNNYYGWARLLVYTSSNGFIIKDYAYNSVPNQPILAGDTGAVSTGITHNNIQANHLSVYPNPATNSATIKFPSDEAGEIQIVNLFGQVVNEQNLGGLETGEIKIDVSKFSKGMYVVRWSAGENYETKIFSVIK